MKAPQDRSLAIGILQRGGQREQLALHRRRQALVSPRQGDRLAVQKDLGPSRPIRRIRQALEKKPTGTPKAPASPHSFEAETRFIPVSYFWTCWNRSPRPAASCCWLIPSSRRRDRIRWPT